ncbi:OmpH family outer membrane protein [Desulfovibrio sp. OttesenSCG-928-A18]|nr:OmpH family outer membrane protein [Desulfovibrio sp. OttesenSCG-928-A18]
MRKILSLTFVLLLLFAGSAFAQELKIGVFDLQKVAEDSDPLKEAMQAIEKKYGPQREQLEKERQAIVKKNEDLSKKKPSQKEQEAFIQEQRAYQEKMQVFARTLQGDEELVRKDIYTVIQVAAKSFAEKNGYSMLLDAVVVPYYLPAIDVTNDMLTEVNKVWNESKTKK